MVRDSAVYETMSAKPTARANGSGVSSSVPSRPSSEAASPASTRTVSRCKAEFSCRRYEYVTTSSKDSIMEGSILTTSRRASGSDKPSALILSSTSASICHTTMRSVIWPIERAIEIAVSSFRTSSRTNSTMVAMAATSCWVKTFSSALIFGKPMARQIFRADTTDTPSSFARSRGVSNRGPPMSSSSNTLMAWVQVSENGSASPKSADRAAADCTISRGRVGVGSVLVSGSLFTSLYFHSASRSRGGHKNQNVPYPRGFEILRYLGCRAIPRFVRVNSLDAGLPILGVVDVVFDGSSVTRRSEEHKSELQSRRQLPPFPTRRSSDLFTSLYFHSASRSRGGHKNQNVPYPRGFEILRYLGCRAIPRFVRVNSLDAGLPILGVVDVVFDGSSVTRANAVPPSDVSRRWHPVYAQPDGW